MSAGASLGNSLSEIENQGELTALHIAQTAEQGDDFALEMVLETARYLGIGIASLVHVIDPAGVVLGGAMTFGGADHPLGRRFLDRVKEEVINRSLGPIADNLQIEYAALGGDAGYIGAAGLAATGVKVSPLWLVASYLLQLWGELCLSPVGLSAMSTLAPARISGLVMGVWFLALSVGSYLAGMAASVYETMPLTMLFTGVTLTALVAGVVLALLIKPIQRMLAS